MGASSKLGGLPVGMLWFSQPSTVMNKHWWFWTQVSNSRANYQGFLSQSSRQLRMEHYDKNGVCICGSWNCSCVAPPLFVMRQACMFWGKRLDTSKSRFWLIVSDMASRILAHERKKNVSAFEFVSQGFAPSSHRQQIFAHLITIHPARAVHPFGSWTGTLETSVNYTGQHPFIYRKFNPCIL